MVTIGPAVLSDPPSPHQSGIVTIGAPVVSVDHQSGIVTIGRLSSVVTSGVGKVGGGVGGVGMLG